jgi:hypothetical protein
MTRSAVDSVADVVQAPPEPAVEPGPAMAAAPNIRPEFTEIAQLADVLCQSGGATRKVTVLGTAAGDSIANAVLALARLLAREARVVVVDLAATSIISSASIDPAAPGLAELVLGEASFAQIITRDRRSRAQLVSAGRPGFDRALLQSPRLTLAIDALLRVYDHVLLDAGTAFDLPAELLTAQARAVVVPDPSMANDACAVMCDQLGAVGFGEVMLLAEQPVDAIEHGSQVEAA